VRCLGCHRDLPLTHFQPNGKRSKNGRRARCRKCTNRQRAYAKRFRTAQQEALEPVKWPVVRKCYHLTRLEAELVQKAAESLIQMHEWKMTRRGEKPPVPDAIISERIRDCRRQTELLFAASRRARELLHLDGVDAGAFFNRGIRTGRAA